VARNADNSSSSGRGRASNRLANTRPAPIARSRLDRRTFWIRFVAGMLVLAMLLPVLAGVISVL
jgi:hypothetical protein